MYQFKLNHNAQRERLQIKDAHATLVLAFSNLSRNLTKIILVYSCKKTQFWKD